MKQQTEWKRVLWLALVAVTTQAFAADEIHWTIAGQNSVTFDWRGTVAETVISYGTSPGVYDANGVYINSFSVNADTPNPLPTSSSGPFWEAKIPKPEDPPLVEDTLYYYAIGSGPEEHTFRTPPLRGSSDFTVFAEADIGASNSDSRVTGVQELIANGFPNFVLAAGDLTYGESDATRVDQHFNDLMAWSQDAAYMPAWGNHDWDASTSKPDQLNNYEGRFDFPNSQTSPGAEAAIGNGLGEDWYWFDYGNTRFIAYPEPFSGAWTKWKTQAQALMDAAQLDSSITFIVTFGHRPAYTSGHHMPSSSLKGILDALGDSHSKYVLNVNGHNHNYERSFPQHRVVHVTVGTGGRNLEQDGSCLWRVCTQPIWSAFRAMHHGAMKLRFTTTGLKGEFICGPAGDTSSNINDVTCNQGEVVDSFTIGTVPPTVFVTEPAPTATVSGTVPVSASASGNSGQVAGVQFQLDANNLGAEDKTDPYSIFWDTTTTTNGAHTLSAIAQDAAGNTASDSITALVNNVTTVTVGPTADATLKSDSPSTNYGAATILEVDNISPIVISPVEQFLMKFTVSGIAGQAVKSAKLCLYNVNPSRKGGDFYRVADNGWTESTVTWNNAPAADATAIASLGAVSTNTWYEVDLTSLITGNGTYSLRVRSTSSDRAEYSSKEAPGFAPRLVVTLQQ